MTSEAKITKNSFLECISSIDEYLGALQQLPDRSSFSSAVEDDLWETVTKQSNPPSEIAYNELPEVTHSLFGKIEEDGEKFDPWWLQEFKWTAEFGGEELTLRDDQLESFAENFDRNRTLTQKPEFSERTYGTEHRSLDIIHEELLRIKTELEKHIEPDNTTVFPKLPETLFAVEQGKVTLTDEFTNWVESFLELIPPLGSEATALYLANTGTSRRSAETALGQELFEELDRLRVFQNSGYNQNYVNPYNKILDSTRILNRRIPTGEEDSELTGLQYQFYRSFIETFEPADESTAELFNSASQRTPRKLNDGELGGFTRIACGSPLILSNSMRPRLMTVSMYSVNTSGKSGYMSASYRTIRRMFEGKRWFENA